MKALTRVIWMIVLLVAGISSRIYAFNDLEFVDASNGWALATYHILHTSDGGQTWSEQQAGEDEIYICMSFVSPAEGWIVSESGSIFHTDDSGNTWVLQANIGEISGRELGYEPECSVDFVDASNGWITVIMEAESFESFGESMILHTSDGGETWNVQKTEQDVFYLNVDFVTPTEGWIVGGRFEYEGFEVRLQGMILHTDDGGNTWTIQKEEEGGFFSHVQFIDPSEGWALGSGMLSVYVFHSVDGGITWVPEGVLRFMEAEDFQFVDSSEGWIVGWEEIMHTTDGGKTWTEQDAGLDEQLDAYAVHFVNPDQGWIAGYYGFEVGEMIIHTSDGGDTWEVQYDEYGEEFVSPESEPAALISTTPAAGGSQPGNAPVTFIFDKSIESAAVSGAPGTVSVTWEQVVWTPEKPYPEGVVTLTLTGEDADGLDVSATLTYTATEIDETPPGLVDDECDPRNGAINVDPADYAELTIAFSEPVIMARVIATEPSFYFTDRLSTDGRVMTIIFLLYTMVHETEYTIVIAATDPAGNEAELTYSFTTMPEGHAAPVVSDIPDQTIEVGDAFTAILLDDYVSDPDNEDAEIVWTYSGNVELSVIISDERIATIATPDPEWTGSENITFTATDPDGLSAGDSAAFTVGTIVLLGDVNDDGAIRSNDAILALRIAAGLMEPTEYQKQAADVNGDGEIKANDAIRILREAAGLAAPGKSYVASAGRPITITLDEAHGVAGGRIMVPVKVDDIRGLAGGDICITYDSALLRAVQVSSHPDMLLVSNIAEPGVIRIAFAGLSSLASKTLANIEFHILADDVSPLKFRNVELYGSDALPLIPVSIDKEFRSWAMKPAHSALLQNYPNPFNPETRIPYQLREGADVTIRIYSATGELVRELNLGYKPTGLYVSHDRAAYWSGRNEAGEQVASGVYFYTIQAGEFAATKKMILAK